jgi:hypothetical protein
VCDDTHLPSLGQCLPYIFTCDGYSTLNAPNGDQVSCCPFRCNATQCISACTSTADCCGGYVCDSQSRCVPS